MAWQASLIRGRKSDNLAAIALLLGSWWAVGAIGASRPIFATVEGDREQVSEQRDDVTIALTRLSQSTKLVLYHARLEFSLRPDNAIEPEHVLLGILRVDPTLISHPMAAGWTTERLERALNLPLASDELVLPENLEVPFSPAVRALLERALRSMEDLKSKKIEPVNLLIAILQDQTLRVVQLLSEAGITLASVLETLRRDQ